MPGKLPPEILRSVIFPLVGKEDRSVLMGPQIGEDAAIIEIGPDEILAIHSDPITGAQKNIGWLSVHIAANDISVRGIKPRWLLPVLLLPKKTSLDEIRMIAVEIDSAAKEIGATVVGGHSEYTPGLDRPIISMTALGIGKKSSLILTQNARVGDLIIMTKSAAIEGTSILAHDFEQELIKLGVNHKIIQKAKEFFKDISVVKEALLLAEKSYVNSMHDPTEGGILGGLTELAYASESTIYVYEENIPIAYETQVICSSLNVNPFKLISSGVLLATLPKENANAALKTLDKHKIKAKVIGEVKKKEGPLVVWVKKDLTKEHYNEVFVEDELFKLLEK